MKCQLMKIGVLIISALTVVAVADFDNNGKADVFVANTTSAAYVQWWEGTGARRTVAYAGQTFGVGVSSLWTGDLDGDGIGDLLVGRGPSTGNGSHWYTYNEGLEWVRSDFAVDCIDFAVGDVTQNGKMDIMYVKNTSGTTVIPLLNVTGPKALASEGKIINTAGALCVAIGDIDGGFGGTDILVGKSSVISWYEYNPSMGSFVWIQNWNAPNSAKRMIIGDFDGDEWPDIIHINQSGTLKWWESHPMGSGTLWIEGNDPDNTQIPDNFNYVDIAFADIDGDGLKELLALKADGTVHWIVAKSAYSSTTTHGVWAIAGGTDFGLTGFPGVAIAASGIPGPTSVSEFMPCGDGVGYDAADLSTDCIVDIEDILLFADQWLQ